MAAFGAAVEGYDVEADFVGTEPEAFVAVDEDHANRTGCFAGQDSAVAGAVDAVATHNHSAHWKYSPETKKQKILGLCTFQILRIKLGKTFLEFSAMRKPHKDEWGKK